MKIALSNLIADPQNPRRVEPEREVHKRLLASIRAFGLLEPLLVRPEEKGKYRVIAGGRRLAALREVHRGEDAAVDCISKRVDADTASAMSLAESFIREPMHPLDESAAFAHLAAVRIDRCFAAIAERFGVSVTYVRQRMKLACLADVVTSAFRKGGIGLSIVEAFAAVPVEQQEALRKKLKGTPRDAEQV